MTQMFPMQEQDKFYFGLCDYFSLGVATFGKHYHDNAQRNLLS